MADLHLPVANVALTCMVTGIRLRVTGNGQRYCFLIKTFHKSELQAFSYEACFDALEQNIDYSEF